MTLWYLIVIGVMFIITMYITRKTDQRIQSILDSMPEGSEKEAYINRLNSKAESYLYYYMDE
jgi:hypothetical protein